MTAVWDEEKESEELLVDGRKEKKEFVIKKTLS